MSRLHDLLDRIAVADAAVSSAYEDVGDLKALEREHGDRWLAAREALVVAVRRRAAGEVIADWTFVDLVAELRHASEAWYEASQARPARPFTYLDCERTIARRDEALAAIEGAPLSELYTEAAIAAKEAAR